MMQPYLTLHTACEPKLGKLFDETRASDSLLTTKVMVTECKYVFEGLTSLVDVGGDNGAVSRAIAKTFPNLKCIVYDLPHVVVEQKGEGNLDFVVGDMFDKIPSANAILLKVHESTFQHLNCSLSSQYPLILLFYIIITYDCCNCQK